MSEWGFTLERVAARWTEGGKNILEDLTVEFRIRDGDCAALPLMGPSGQGKSTLLYLLAALKWPSAGTVTWKFPSGERLSWGENSGGITPEKAGQLRRNRFGFAFQASTLSPHLTVHENIAYPLLLQGKTWKSALEHARKCFDKVLLPYEKPISQALLQCFPRELSGGQLQRAALVQASVHNPDVLFADEPTGQLDLHTRKQVMDVLKKWLEQERGQRCLIWVTHHHLTDLDFMKVNELFFVEDGRCVWRDRQWLEYWIKQVEKR